MLLASTQPVTKALRALLCLAALAALCLAVSSCSDRGQAQENAGAPPAARVEAMILNPTSATFREELSGRANAWRVSEVRPQVTGLVHERLFKEGQQVEKGQPLYKIEDTDYQAAEASAKASLARAEATAELAGELAKRLKGLVETKAVSIIEYEEAALNARQAEAEVAISRAALNKAQMDMERTLVRAPISGTIGRSSVTAGALVTQNQDRALATIRQLDPIYLDLTASSTDMLKWRRELVEGRITKNEDGHVPVSITLEDGTDYDLEGTLEFSEVNIDEATGTVTLRATVPNPDNYILPGAFLRASIPVGLYQNAFLVPQAGVLRSPRGEPYAYVVGEDGTAEQRMLSVAGAEGENWIVTSGLNDAEQLIVSGLMMLRPGTAVSVIKIDEGASEDAQSVSESETNISSSDS